MDRPAFAPSRRNLGAAMARNAERKRCPKCGRGGAIVFLPDTGTVCKWTKCGYWVELDGTEHL